MSDSNSPWISERSFADFPISPEVLAGLEGMGFTKATPVQAMTIDPALAGRDLLVRAKTGTGKTAAFCVPIVERIEAGSRAVRAIMLTPTRELAVQVAQECANIAKFKDLRILTIYGGVGFGPQETALKEGVEIVVGTPGRILDHLRRGNLKLDQVGWAVLDEADEMLSMGFLEDVRKILDKTPKERQTFMFSATVDESVKGLIARYQNNPEEVFLSYDGDNVDTITHYLYETSPDYHKARALLDLIELEKPSSALIFCNTKEDVATVYTYLDRQGLGVEMISGDLPQKQRERVMARVKAGAVQFLVSTDVAARGIDISDLSHVINYSLPDDASVYLHRCGRTGRIGKTGTVLNLVGGQDFSTHLTLLRQHKINFEPRALPNPEESARLRTERLSRSVKEAAGSTAYEAWLDVARAIKERPDADTLIAVLLKGFLVWDRQRKIAMADEANPEDAQAAADARRSHEERHERRRERDDRRGERPRDRDDRPREARADRPREDRPREDRPREERKREDRPRREDRPERPRREPPPVATPAPTDEAPPAPVDRGGDDEETDDAPTAPPGTATTEAGEATKRRRRRRRRTGTKADGTPAASEPAAE